MALDAWSIAGQEGSIMTDAVEVPSRSAVSAFAVIGVGANAPAARVRSR